MTSSMLAFSDDATTQKRVLNFLHLFDVRLNFLHLFDVNALSQEKRYRQSRWQAPLDTTTHQYIVSV